jgi:hypothetical protein
MKSAQAGFDDGSQLPFHDIPHEPSRSPADFGLALAPQPGQAVNGMFSPSERACSMLRLSSLLCPFTSPRSLPAAPTPISRSPLPLRCGLLGGLLGALLLCACSSVTRVYQTPRGLVLEDHADTRLDKTYFAAELAQARGRTIEIRLLSPPKTIDRDTSRVLQLKPEEWEPWRRNFQDALATLCFRSRIFSVVATPNDPKPLTNPDLRFDFAVTQWNEGTGWKRYIIGFGAGATTVQWEGALIDVRAKRVLFAFADRRLHPGGPSMLSFNFKPFHGGSLIAKDLAWSAEDLFKTLRELTDTTEPTDDNAARPLVHKVVPPSPPIKYSGPPPPSPLAPPAPTPRTTRPASRTSPANPLPPAARPSDPTPTP